jgi:hypothetical protein
MQARCPKCANKAEVSLTAKGFSYDFGPRAFLCPIIKERADKEGGRTSDQNCDHMAKAAQEVSHRMRRGS